MHQVACSIDQRIKHLIDYIKSQFYVRTVIEGRKPGRESLKNLSLNIETSKDKSFWMTFSNGKERHSVNFPIPYEVGGVSLITQNEVVRAVCNFWIERDQTEFDYLSVMRAIIMEDCSSFVSLTLAKKTFYLQQMIYGFLNGNASIIANRFQKAINEIVLRMPLHETMLNSWVMNKRLIIIDPLFDILESPDQRLSYQKNKAVQYFDRGWTALGLSDGVLADKNYILKEDIRKLTPFGMHFHNPQRNLYSTLGMRGDELPLVRSESMQNLMNKGISRRGWNLTTAFVDIPDVFEDQIVVDRSLLDKFVTHERRFQIFGDVLVKEGQAIKTGQPIGTHKDGGTKNLNVICDSAVVKKVARSVVNVGGNKTNIHNVIIEYRRNFRDALKITNLHGNKGVIRIRDIGYAVNPVTGEKTKIEVIVGAKTVGKRRNYGQILEALLNNVVDLGVTTTPEPGFFAQFLENAKKLGKLCTVRGFSHTDTDAREHIVIPDDWCQSVEEIEAGIVKHGFRKDGTWDCDTYAGKLKAVVGKVFWGCIKTPEDQLWEKGETEKRNGKELRKKGLKFSHVEFKALRTRFGNDNPIMDEILSYAQGTENLRELFWMASSKMGNVPQNKITIDPQMAKPLEQTTGTILEERCLVGTIVDENFLTDGFIMKLPLPFQTVLNEYGKVLCSGPPIKVDSHPEATVIRKFQTDRLYIPSGIMRKCWKHDNGMYGLSEIGVIVNNVAVMTHKLLADPQNEDIFKLYYIMLEIYFDRLSSILCTKSGDIATLGMSVRFPFSVKAVATQAPELPKNTVEIHRSMADILQVHNGDVVVAERFPCLGFMSVRLQKVKITDDEMCRYTIRVSGNSLVSQNLDHDGDVLYLAAMQTPGAKLCLQKEFDNPNKTCYDEIDILNKRKGAPHTKCYGIDDFCIIPFKNLTCEEHAEIVEKNTGVKAQTGPVIALTYNLMRIVENSTLADNQKMKVAVEMFLEKAAQSVFEQKHGGQSLYKIVTDGICTGDVESLVSVGFKRGTTEKLCALIRHKAGQLGVSNLEEYHARIKAEGGGNIIGKIVRMQNRIYFASRASLEAINLIDALSSPVVDIPSEIYTWVMSGKAMLQDTVLDKVIDERKLATIKSDKLKGACADMFSAINSMFRHKLKRANEAITSYIERFKECFAYMGVAHGQIS